MKTFNTVIALAVMSVITLSGCGTTNDTQNGASNTVVNSTTSSSPSATQNNPTSIKDGVTKMLAIANELKASINAGDAAKVKESGPKLEDVWRSFEDSVKPKYPDSYAKVEQYLDPTVAGSKAAPLDKQTLSKLNNELIQALSDLHDKVNG